MVIEMKITISMVLAIFMCLTISGCQQGTAELPEETQQPMQTEGTKYVYPGEETTMAWSNPAFEDEKYAEGATLSVWVNATKNPEKEYSYSGTVHWVENHENHIFSLLCLPDDYDGTQQYPLLLMVHGYNSNFHEYNFFVNDLNEAGFAVLLFDFRGGSESSSLSDGKLTQMSYDTKLSDIRAMTEYAETLPMADKDNFIFVGHSQGGMMGAIVACTDGLKDRFNGMLLFAPAMWHAEYIEEFGSVDNFPKSYTFLYAKVGRDFLCSAVKYEDIIWENVKNYDFPVKILCGANDDFDLDENMEEILEAFGDGATLEMVEDGHHDFRDDVLPELMPNTILPFLESLKK